jgi:hypothetical protein
MHDATLMSVLERVRERIADRQQRAVLQAAIAVERGQRVAVDQFGDQVVRPASSPLSNSATIAGCASLAAARASRSMRMRSRPSPSRDRGIRLTATRRRNSWSSAIQTVPWPPEPIVSTRR